MGVLRKCGEAEHSLKHETGEMCVLFVSQDLKDASWRDFSWLNKLERVAKGNGKVGCICRIGGTEQERVECDL
jgi:hypothetical protein